MTTQKGGFEEFSREIVELFREIHIFGACCHETPRCFFASLKEFKFRSKIFLRGIVYCSLREGLGE
jgi:hypothetical protein